MILIPNYNPSFDQPMPICLFLDSSFYMDSTNLVNFKKVRYSRIHCVTSFYRKRDELLYYYIIGGTYGSSEAQNAFVAEVIFNPKDPDEMRVSKSILLQPWSSLNPSSEEARFPEKTTRKNVNHVDEFIKYISASNLVGHKA